MYRSIKYSLIMLLLSGMFGLSVHADSEPIPYREDFENATLNNSYTNSGWHAITNTGVMTVVSDTFETTQDQAMSLRGGIMNIEISGTDGTNVWIQIYTKPVIPAMDEEVPIIGSNEVATFYVASGGVLWASSGGDFSNCLDVMPADTWLGFAAHLDYTSYTWDLYVATNGIFGDDMVRANDTPLAFNTNTSYLTNVIIELLANETMYVDVLAVSHAHTNIVSAYSNVVAYDRLVDLLRTAGMPPYNYGTINSVTNTLEGLLGEYLMWGMDADDELRVTYTNGVNLYTLASGTTWQGDGNAMSYSNIFINKSTAMEMKKLSGRDTVVFYPFEGTVQVATNVLIVGTDNPIKNGWNFIESPFSEVRTFNHPSMGLMLTNLASQGDRIYLNGAQLIFTSSTNWIEGQAEATRVLGPNDSFWYYNKSETNFTWIVPE